MWAQRAAHERLLKKKKRDRPYNNGTIRKHELYLVHERQTV